MREAPTRPSPTSPAPFARAGGGTVSVQYCRAPPPRPMPQTRGAPSACNTDGPPLPGQGGAQARVGHDKRKFATQSRASYLVGLARIRGSPPVARGVKTPRCAPICALMVSARLPWLPAQLVRWAPPPSPLLRGVTDRGRLGGGVRGRLVREPEVSRKAPRAACQSCGRRGGLLLVRCGEGPEKLVPELEWRQNCREPRFRASFAM